MSPDVNAGETTPQSTSRRGSLVAGRYRIDSMIAAGGMGEVWRATDEVLGRVVSVKFLHPQFAADESFLERMLREARAASAINHPGVVAVYDFGRIDPEDGVPTSYIVMEHVDGPSLSQLLAEGPISVDESLMILEQTAAALHAAHKAGVVHRDVKPGNIIMTPNGNVKLTDFGIARSQDTSTITDSGSITGTATYLSPEQASGEKATETSDLYSLGVVIYSCLSGKVPFDRDGPVAIALAHLKDPPPPLPEQIPGRGLRSRDVAAGEAAGRPAGRRRRRPGAGRAAAQERPDRAGSAGGHRSDAPPRTAAASPRRVRAHRGRAHGVRRRWRRRTRSRLVAVAGSCS